MEKVLKEKKRRGFSFFFYQPSRGCVICVRLQMQEEDSVNNNANDDECLMNLSERRDKNLFFPPSLAL